MSQSHANTICEISLRGIRAAPQETWPLLEVDNWRVGRCSSCAAIFPSIETISAANEANFLVGYNKRHGAYKS